MEIVSKNMSKHESPVNELKISKALLLVFLPPTILMSAYILLAQLFGEMLPTLLLFFIVAMLVLFPIQLFIVLHASKKEHGTYTLASAFSNHQELSWWKIITYASLLFGFAGLMTITIAPLENMLFAPIVNRLFDVIPPYFDWANIDYLQNYSKSILVITCVLYFLLNVIILPIMEELFFRGYLTAKMNRFGNYTPFVVTVLFSLYHFWLPFTNLFRIIAFYPAYYIAWKKKNIYIAIVFHCLCNLVSTIVFIVAVYAIL